MFVFCSITDEMNAQVLVIRNSPRDISKMSTIDAGKIRVWYALNAVDIRDESTYDDWERLEIGSHISRYYSYFIFRSDSLCTEWGKKNPKASSVPTGCGSGGKQSGRWSEYYHSDFIKDFSKKILTQYTYMPHRIPCYQYTEDIPVQNWSLQDDTTTIAGYLCQKAICSFRGRDFEAWFAVNIPINNGPWKFGGLPGLILKVSDIERLYVFECTSIEVHNNEFPIEIHSNVKYENINREKYRKLVESINVDYFKLTGWQMERYIEQPPYHPLELE